LHCSSGNLYGGVETLLTTLARSTPATSVRPEFALCFAGRLSAELCASGAVVHDLEPVRLSRPWTVLRARRKLERLLARDRFDVVVCHGGWPHWICGPVVRRDPETRLVFWLHDLAGGTHWVERLASRTPPDLVLAGSCSAAETIDRLFPGSPRAVFHPPVPAPESDRAEARASVRAELGTDQQTTVIVLASRLDPLKGHATLIEALGRLRPRPSWEVWIAGGAQRPQERVYLEELQRLARAVGVDSRLRFLGHRTDVPRLLAAADLFCQPNLRPESFGLAFVEAMDAALPIITSRMGAAEEIVDPSCGILVPAGDVSALAEALARLIDSPAARRRLGQSGPARARELCDPTTAMARLESLYQGVVHEAGCRRHEPRRWWGFPAEAS
jgi:glycosyltransferase involved in cell wall biosynthesis